MKLRSIFLLAFLLGVSATTFAQAKKAVLIEKFTSRSCGACGNGGLILEDILGNHPDAIAVAHHVSPNYDPMTKSESMELWNFYGWGTPSCMFDRGSNAVSSGSWESTLSSAESLDAIADVTLSFNYDENTRDLTVDVSATFKRDMTGEYRLNCYLIEDKVTGGGIYEYSQHNYYNNVMGHPHYGLGAPIMGYEHNHVPRHYFGGAWGSLNSVTIDPDSGSMHQIQYQITVPDSFMAHNLSLVAFVQGYGSQLADRKVGAAVYTDLGVEVSIEDNLDQSTFMVYPNPTKDVLNIQTTITGEMQINLIDFQGKSLAKWSKSASSFNDIRLELPTLQSGMYFLQVQTNEGSFDKKIVIR